MSGSTIPGTIDSTPPEQPPIDAQNASKVVAVVGNGLNTTKAPKLSLQSNDESPGTETAFFTMIQRRGAQSIHSNGSQQSAQEPAPGMQRRSYVADRDKDKLRQAGGVFGGLDVRAMKEQLREQMHKPTYDVRDMYRKDGIFQYIARSHVFEMITLAVIVLNAIWMGVDADLNDAEILLDAAPVFIVAENLFCMYFTVEVVIRFYAFEHKRACLRDSWFLFDTALVILMVFETWVMTGLMLALHVRSGEGIFSNTAVLRSFKLLRLTRLTRMARLLRSMPEMLIIIKGIVSAIRPVCFTLFLLFLLLYLFSIIFKQLTVETDVGGAHFGTVADAGHTLLLCGVLMDNMGELVWDINDEDAGTRIVLLFAGAVFVLLASLTVMNMLIGILCDVVSAVAATEQEAMTIASTKEKLHSIVMQFVDPVPGQATPKEDDVQITKEKFLEILKHPVATNLLTDIDVDVVSLVDLVDTIFVSETGSERVLSFGDLLETCLGQRSTQAATIRDITSLRKYGHARLDRLEKQGLQLEAMFEAHAAALSTLLEVTTGKPPPSSPKHGEIARGKSRVTMAARCTMTKVSEMNDHWSKKLDHKAELRRDVSADQEGLFEPQAQNVEHDAQNARRASEEDACSRARTLERTIESVNTDLVVQDISHPSGIGEVQV